MHKVGAAQEEPRHNIDRLELYTNRLMHLLDAGQAGDIQPTTGNCYLAVISTVFVNHIALLLRTIILYRTKGCLLSFVCVSHFLKTVHA